MAEGSGTGILAGRWNQSVFECGQKGSLMVDGQVYCHFHQPGSGVWVAPQPALMLPESKESIMRNFLCDLPVEDDEKDGFGNERIKLVVEPLELETAVPAYSHVISY